MDNDCSQFAVLSSVTAADPSLTLGALIRLLTAYGALICYGYVRSLMALTMK